MINTTELSLLIVAQRQLQQRAADCLKDILQHLTKGQEAMLAFFPQNAIFVNANDEQSSWFLVVEITENFITLITNRGERLGLDDIPIETLLILARRISEQDRSRSGRVFHSETIFVRHRAGVHVVTNPVELFAVLSQPHLMGGFLQCEIDEQGIMTLSVTDDFSFDSPSVPWPLN